MINFEEQSHTYTHSKTNEKYISVTTLIHNYVPEFDEAYWSLYKSVKDVLTIISQQEVAKFVCVL